MKNNWFVANLDGDVAGHDLSWEKADALAAKLREEEPDADWEAMEDTIND